MGRVWLKTRYDSEMNMEIPHNHNFAVAMYGFRELGAEIIPYHTIDEIYDDVDREDIVLDYIEQCKTIFGKFGAKSQIPDYPDSMKAFLGRRIWKDTIDSIASDEEKWSAGYFVKPIHDKAFTGKIISRIADLIGCGNSTENYEVLVSEPLDILAEWRGFIIYDKLVDLRPYGILLNRTRQSYLYHYDGSTVREMMKAFCEWEDRPAACSMDICYTKDGRTLLVEFNDAYSLGAYGLPDIVYAKLISARWAQLMRREDEYNF
ncbi:MAG: ATP-grasp domain-containing protein [Lachnospiraceae bacterium]|nr:ATP-grasp domain-containing protein [Lachnospiraceae bacterium]